MSPFVQQVTGRFPRGPLRKNATRAILHPCKHKIEPAGHWTFPRGPVRFAQYARFYTHANTKIEPAGHWAFPRGPWRLASYARFYTHANTNRLHSAGRCPRGPFSQPPRGRWATRVSPFAQKRHTQPTHTQDRASPRGGRSFACRLLRSRSLGGFRAAAKKPHA